MKKTGLTLLTVFCVGSLFAQDTTKIVRKTFTGIISGQFLDTNQVAYDESGNALRYYQYQKLLKSGEYSIRYKISPTDTTQKRYLVKLNAQEKLRIMERYESSITARSPFLTKNKTLDIQPLLDYITELELGNRNILLLFWNSGCPPCLEYFSKVDEIIQKMSHPEDLIVLSITSDTRAKAKSILSENPFKNGKLISDARSISQAYQLSAYPTFVLADRNRIIQFSATGAGAYTEAVIEKNLRAMGL